MGLTGWLKMPCNRALVPRYEMPEQPLIPARKPAASVPDISDKEIRRRLKNMIGGVFVYDPKGSYIP